MLPGEAEQIALIDQAESETPSAFSIPQETVDRALQTGGNAADLRLQVALLYLREEPAEEIAAALPELYRGGNGLRTPRGDLSVWFGPDGVRMAYGHSARYDAQAQRLTWPDAAARIARLLEEGRYATREELTEAPGYARRTLARSLRYLYYDIASREQAEQAFPLLATLTDGSFAEDMQRLDQALADRDFCAALSEELAAFRDALREHPELLRLSYHRLDSMQEQLAALRQPLRAYANAAPETPQMEGFITEDEIRQALVESCRVSGGLERIDAYFRQHAAPRDRAVFLSETFGIGGRSHALSGAAHSAESHDRSGIRLQKGNCPEVRLTWHQAAIRLDELMRNGRHREGQEQDSFPEAPGDGPHGGSSRATLRPGAAGSIQACGVRRAYGGFGLPERLRAFRSGKRGPSKAERLSGVRCWLPAIWNWCAAMRTRKSFAAGCTRSSFRKPIPDCMRSCGPSPRRILTMRCGSGTATRTASAPFLRTCNPTVRRRGRQAGYAAPMGTICPLFPVTIRGSAADLPWEDVRRFLAALIAEEHFFTPEEQDEEIHPAAIRQALEARGIVDGQVVDQEKLDSDPFLRQVMADAARAEAARETAEPVGEKPETAAMETVSPALPRQCTPGRRTSCPSTWLWNP